MDTWIHGHRFIYLAMSGDSLDEIVNPEMKQAYETDTKNWLATDKFRDRTPYLFRSEFVGTRGVWLTAKCDLVQNDVGKNKYSYKVVSEKHNDLHFQRYKKVLNVSLKARRDSELKEQDIDRAKNVGFRIYNHGMVTYEQSKLGLSAYYYSCYVLANGIHTRPLDS